MSNINWGQFLNNFANNFNRVITNNVQNTLNETFTPQTQQNTSSILFQNTQTLLNQTSAELASLNQTQTVDMVKELLNIPKTFESFLSQLAANTQNISKETALSLLASNMNLTELSSLLQTNSKTAMTNLYQMLAQYNQVGVSMKDEQMSTLTKLISIVSTSSSSDVQSLKTIMLMYLPWLPLTDPNAFKLEISNSASGGEGSLSDSITILISTENYGNLRTNVCKTDEDGIKIELVSSNTFPQKEFVNLMKEESEKYNININLTLSKKDSFNKDKKENLKTQVFINTSPGVNPFLLLISNTVIKNVHIIDTKENLRELRKEKINGKN